MGDNHVLGVAKVSNPFSIVVEKFLSLTCELNLIKEKTLVKYTPKNYH